MNCSAINFYFFFHSQILQKVSRRLLVTSVLCLSNCYSCCHCCSGQFIRQLGHRMHVRDVPHIGISLCCSDLSDCRHLPAWGRLPGHETSRYLAHLTGVHACTTARWLARLSHHVVAIQVISRTNRGGVRAIAVCQRTSASHDLWT